jgi:hypothetical protein
MQGGFHHDAPEVVWALLELLDAVGAEAELAEVEPLLATVVEVVDAALVVELEPVAVVTPVVDDVLAVLADDVVPVVALETRLSPVPEVDALEAELVA